jgi:hypothetical protein
MIATPLIVLVRGLLLGTSIVAFAFAAISIPTANRAAMTSPPPPPVPKIVYKLASNPFALDPVGEEAPPKPVPRPPATAIPPFPNLDGNAPHVPGISGLASSVQLTGIVLGDAPLAMVVENSHSRTVGIGDRVGNTTVTNISASDITLSDGEHLRPGASRGGDTNGFVFPMVAPGNGDKGQLMPTVANPNGVQTTPAAPGAPVPATGVSTAPAVAPGYPGVSSTAAPTPANVLQILQQAQQLAPSPAPTTH